MSGRHLNGARRLIADAAIRVIAGVGFDTVSVRSVANEAGLAAGTVQHHFSSRDELLVGALNRVLERQLQRTMTIGRSDDPVVTLRRTLEEILPFDETRRQEAIVWLVFSASASSRPSLQAPQAAGIALMRDLIRDALAQPSLGGTLRPLLDLDMEAVLLAATVDGLLMHALNTSTEDHPLIERALAGALERLFVPIDDRQNAGDV